MAPGGVLCCTSPVSLSNFTVLHTVLVSSSRLAAISLLVIPNTSLCHIILHLRSAEYADALLVSQETIVGACRQNTEVQHSV